MHNFVSFKYKKAFYLIISVICLAIIVFAVIWFISGSKEVFAQKYENIEYIYGITGIAVDPANGDMYLADNENVLVYSIEGIKKRVLNFEGYIVESLCIDNEGKSLILIDVTQNLLLKADRQGNIIEEYELSNHFEEVGKIKKVNEYVFVFGRNYGRIAESPNLFVKYNLSSSKEEIINIDKMYNFTINIKDKNSPKLMVLINDTKFTIEERCALSNELVKIYSYPEYINISDFEFDEKNEQIIYASYKSLFRWDLKQKIELIREIDQKCSLFSTKIGFFPGKSVLYILDCSNKTIEAYTTIPYEDKKASALYIQANFNNEYLDIYYPGEIKKFEDSHNIKIKFVNYNESQLAKKLMAGDVDLDIFSIVSKNTIAYSYISKDAFFDLSQSKLIKDFVDSRVEFVKEGSYYNNKLIGIPTSMYGYVLYYNSSFLKSTFNISYNGEEISWEEFFELCKSMTNANKSLAPFALHPKASSMQVISQYIYNYNDVVNRRVNLDTPKFINSLELQSEMSSFFSSIIDVETYIRQRTPLIDGQGFGISYLNIKRDVTSGYNTDFKDYEYSFCKLPVIEKGKKQKTPVDVGWLIINKRSKNIDLAIKFLEILATKPQAISSVPAEDDLDENIREVMDNYVVDFAPSIYGSSGSAILIKFMQGKIDAETAAKELDKNAQMMIGE